MGRKDLYFQRRVAMGDRYSSLFMHTSDRGNEEEEENKNLKRV